MKNNKSTVNGWSSIPLTLKILFVLLVIWALGSLTAIPMRFEKGLPFYGLYLYGITASLVVFALDFIAPVIFLIALWKRKPCAVKFAFFYMTIFILNSVVALFTVREQLGLIPILVPLSINILFLIVIYLNRKYFIK